MDTVLLFALPLVGGLIFSSTWNYTRWNVAREEGHRLYFRAVFWGAIIFAIVAFARAVLGAKVPIYAATENIVKAYLVPLAKEPTAAAAVADLAITCFVTMLAGFPLALLLNLIFWRGYWLRRAIRKNEFETFLLDAADREFPIAATMDDGKVYVGYVVHGFDPAIGRKCILVLPLMSGYREEKTHRVHFTTFYTALYGDVAMSAQGTPLPGALAHLHPEDFTTLLPVDRIASCRLFDAEAYKAFQTSTVASPEEAAAVPEPPSPRGASVATWAAVAVALVASLWPTRRRDGT